MCQGGNKGLSVCARHRQRVTVWHMKHVWRMNGTFLHWEMTIRVRPADEPPRKITEPMESDALVRMKQLAKHFEEVANLHEFSLEFDSVYDIRHGLWEHGEPL